MALVRLGDAALTALPEAVATPRYDRAALRCGIVHLGVGAFQRAHLAVATEAALHASQDLSWGIAGVSGDERLVAALAPLLRSLRERGALATLENMR